MSNPVSNTPASNTPADGPAGSPVDGTAGSPAVGSAGSAAQREREAARTMDLRGQVFVLLAAFILFLAFLALPYAGSTRGFVVLLRLPAADGLNIGIVETVFMVLLTIGVGILTPITLLTRNANAGLVAWMMTTVAFAISLMVFWMRGTSGVGANIGLYIGVLAAGVATVSYSLVALRRSPAQREAEQRAREEAARLDVIGEVQSRIRPHSAGADNPLLVDDRRAQAARRHRAQRAQQAERAEGAEGAENPRAEEVLRNPKGPHDLEIRRRPESDSDAKKP